MAGKVTRLLQKLQLNVNRIGISTALALAELLRE